MNAYTLLIAVVLGLGLLPSLQATRVLDTEKPEIGGGHLPTKLSLSSYYFRGKSTVITWDGKALQLEKSVGGKTTRKEKITPSEKSWKKFWKEMDAIGIWKWNEKYIDERYADGHSWDVLLEYGDKQIHAIGRNMYPARFERYEKAVLELLGEKVK
ncbi:MAG: hypothetical protein V7641_4283 [Blastocatellia bacterium]